MSIALFKPAEPVPGLFRGSSDVSFDVLGAQLTSTRAHLLLDCDDSCRHQCRPQRLGARRGPDGQFALEVIRQHGHEVSPVGHHERGEKPDPAVTTHGFDLGEDAGGLKA